VLPDGPRRSSRDVADEMMALVGLTSKADRLVGELAHGDQRTTEIGMALAQAAAALLLDEPTAGMGDEETYAINRLDSPPASRQQIHDRA